MEQWLKNKTGVELIDTFASLSVVLRIVEDGAANGESTKPTLEEARQDVALARAELLRRLDASVGTDRAP